jgi:hypothetical protein
MVGALERLAQGHGLDTTAHFLRMARNKMDKEQSFGERAVGLSFNPSGSGLVDSLKRASAEFVDACNNERNLTTDPEVKRMYSVAITEAQTAQMWAVKAATWRS